MVCAVSITGEERELSVVHEDVTKDNSLINATSQVDWLRKTFPCFRGIKIESVETKRLCLLI